MEKLIIQQILRQEGFFMVSKVLIKSLGLVEASVLAMLIDKHALHGDDFFVTAETAQETLNIGRRPYDSAISSLKEKGYISTYLKDSPPKTHFIINYELIGSQFVQNAQFNLCKTHNSICAKRTTNNNIVNNNNNNNSLSLFEDSEIPQVQPVVKEDLEFERFWKVYDKKVQRAQAEKMWKKLSVQDKQEILERVALYVLSTPDVQYRMNPATYINPMNKRWQDEIVKRESPKQEDDHIWR